MRHETVTASDLARNTSDILERILAGESIAVVRNKTEIAHIIPARRMMKATQFLSGLSGRLTAKQAESWLKDSRGGGFIEEVKDPWE